MTRYQLKTVRVVLACGCTLLTRNRPMNPGSNYPCPSGMGHGYSVGWLSYTDTQTGTVSSNRAAGQPDVVLAPAAPREASEAVRFCDVVEGDRLHFGTGWAGKRYTTWRDGTVSEVRASSVMVDCTDGSRAQLDRKTWPSRAVTRYV